MFGQGIVGLSLALLTATPVLAQMGSPPGSASNTGGTQALASGEPPKAPVAGPTPTTTGDANGACSSIGTPQASPCTPPGGPKSTAPATQPPRDLLHKSAA